MLGSLDTFGIQHTFNPEILEMPRDKQQETFEKKNIRKLSTEIPGLSCKSSRDSLGQDTVQYELEDSVCKNPPLWIMKTTARNLSDAEANLEKITIEPDLIKSQQLFNEIVASFSKHGALYIPRHNTKKLTPIKDEELGSKLFSKREAGMTSPPC